MLIKKLNKRASLKRKKKSYLQLKCWSFYNYRVFMGLLLKSTHLTLKLW